MYLKSMRIWVLGFWNFCRNRTDDRRINSPALWPTELVLHRLGCSATRCKRTLFWLSFSVNQTQQFKENTRRQPVWCLRTSHKRTLFGEGWERWAALVRWGVEGVYDRDYYICSPRGVGVECLLVLFEWFVCMLRVVLFLAATEAKRSNMPQTGAVWAQTGLDYKSIFSFFLSLGKHPNWSLD